MQENNKNPFLEQIRSFIEKKYGKGKTIDILDKAYCKYTKLSIENKDEAEGIKRHTKDRIYPAISLFHALCENEISRDEAKEVLASFYAARNAKVAKTIRKIMKIPFLYKLIPSLARKGTLTNFSENCGFTNIFYETVKSELRFDMTSCPYHYICVKYDCPEIVAMFCDADIICFGSMHKKVIFERSKTLGHGGDCCDFRIYIKKD